jgi:outer membrane protein, multidrug efflux system
MRLMQLFVRKYLLILLLAISAQGCVITAQVDDSKPDVGNDYGLGDTGISDAALHWSDYFADTSLVNLIEEALANNLDARMALQRIAIAQSQSRIVRSALFPQLSMGGSASVRRYGDYTMDGVGNDDTNRSEPVLEEGKRLPKPYTDYKIAPNFAWEADIWGKLRHKKKAALSRWLASKEGMHWMQTEIVSQVATLYFQLMGLDNERTVILQNIELQELGMELIKIQKIGGKVNQLAVDQFEAQFLNTQSRLPEIEQAIIANESAINLLLGRYPQKVERNSTTLAQHLPDSVHLGLPGDLLVFRPDIKKAELELEAAKADVHAAKAAFYPTLILNGELGFQAFGPDKLFVPGSGIYALGAGLSAPLFQMGKIKAQFAQTKGMQNNAVLNYQKTILQAFNEVYVSYNAFENIRKRVAIKSEEVEVQKRAFTNSSDLFSVGYASYLEVIMAQRRMVEAQLELTQLRADQLKAKVDVYKALGGGWAE